MFLCHPLPPLHPPLKVWILSWGLTQTGQKWLEIRLLGNSPVSQVACCRYTLLAWNSSISLAGSEEHINFSQQSPNRSDYTQRESNKGKGTEVKQSPPLPFCQGKSLGTRLKRGPPLWVRCREVAVKRLGTKLPPDHRKLQISKKTKTSLEGERLGLKFFNRKKTLDRDFTSIVGDARKMFHRPLALQPAPKPDFLFPPYAEC